MRPALLTEPADGRGTALVPTLRTSATGAETTATGAGAADGRGEDRGRDRDLGLEGAIDEGRGVGDLFRPGLARRDGLGLTLVHRRVVDLGHRVADRLGHRLGLLAHPGDDDRHPRGQRGVRGGDHGIERPEGHGVCGEEVGDGEVVGRHDLLHPGDIKGDLLGVADRQVQALAPERRGPGDGQLGALGADVQLGESGVDRRGGRVVRGGFPVERDGERAPIADDDALAVIERLVRGRHDDVVRPDRDALARQQVCDRAGECVDLRGLAIDGQGHGLVEGGDTEGSGEDGCCDGCLGNTTKWG